MPERPSPRPEPVRDEDGYADLASYAAIGDGRTVALVARDGRVDWLPVPELDSPPLFAALLDAPHGGVVELAPDEPFTVEREYVLGTNVLATTFTTASGSVRVTDSLDTGVAGRLPWLELSRRIDGLTGSVRLTGRIAPGTCFATLSPWAHGTVHGTVLRAGDVTLAPRTLGDAGVELGPADVTVAYTTRPGSRHLLGLVATRDEPLLLPRPEDMDASVDRTVAAWRQWTDAVAYDGPWREQVTRSALLLKLLIYAPSGAVAAAATTSLPETTDGEGAWDYRYAWVRDVAYSLTALFRFGVREETHAAITWMLRTIGVDGDPAVVYRLDGRPTDRTEHVLHAPGWRGARVVAGNRAASQLQLGVFGDVFSIVQLYVDHGNVLDDRTGRALTGIADRAADLWRQPDSGMWELTELRHYTTSKLGCWQALTQAAHLADQGQLTGDARRWRHEADAIRAWVDEHCWDEEQGAYTWYPGTDGLDASIVLHAISGFDRGPRMSSTLDALRSRLGAGPHLYRTSDHVGVEGAFVACGFWTVSALALCGRLDEAEALMEDLLAVCPNDVGVLAEMVDPDTGAFLGNLPQGLSHLALVQAALTVDDARRG
ncbi:glycoside hydrolase family 15 protein [Lapillicoccus jejuensis]|uniref:GH15 family glucan-1,4-alpha-glucosidase n=1 Tax=Lapillicoccus jejuensis TaxID=402171 RepID=A0A542DXK0_9MICO|nr:glycoside hydrolase family 15 protein [Lapillicoccus jejuensis]TQJ07809.1 GH15 family glucan-1,4-alpha-glucosidase [Lapillicoccus jejuensis]